MQCTNFWQAAYLGNFCVLEFSVVTKNVDRSAVTKNNVKLAEAGTWALEKS